MWTAKLRNWCRTSLGLETAPIKSFVSKTRFVSLGSYCALPSIAGKLQIEVIEVTLHGARELPIFIWPVVAYPNALSELNHFTSWILGCLAPKSLASNFNLLNSTSRKERGEEWSEKLWCLMVSCTEHDSSIRVLVLFPSDPCQARVRQLDDEEGIKCGLRNSRTLVSRHLKSDALL